MKPFFLFIFAAVFGLAGMSQNAVGYFAGFEENTLILKLKENQRCLATPAQINHEMFNQVSEFIGVVSLRKLFPFAEVLEAKKNERGDELVDLSLIYELKYQEEISMFRVQKMFYDLDLFEYVDFMHYYKPMYIPNDPNRGSQYYLNRIRAYDAWDISKGDSNIVIAIIDTGMDFNHLDLRDKVAYNYADPIDGIDNDNDGYVDNFRGWDFGTNDNNPQITSGNHGVFVAGIAAAHTDNNIGIAGVGFRSKFLPIKIANADERLVNAYEAIVYAANQGAKVINCSWGGKLRSGSPFEQDVINYATFNRGSLVIAAAGNDNNDVPFYPASYKNVMSVSMTDANDAKGAASSYGFYVDIAAPGQSVYSTIQGNSYTSSSGTSFAAPVVAGSAAILMSHFPHLSPLQIAERLRVTADNIDTIPANLPFAKKLGLGRVNLYNALTFPEMPSVRLIADELMGVDIQTVKAGDTLFIMPVFKNYLADVSNLTVRLVSLSSNVTVIEPERSFAQINSMTGFSPDFAYKVVLGNTIPNDFWVNLMFEFEADNYYAYDYLQYNVNRSYIPVDENLILTTMTSNGRLGYLDALSSMGNGFRYGESGTLFSMAGIMFGTSTTHVSNNVYAQNGFDDHFFPLVLPLKKSSPIFADFEAYAEFNDDNAGLNKLQVSVKHAVYAWNDAETEKFVIHEYVFRNQSNVILDDFYAGLFVDWDIKPLSYNRVKYDMSNKLFYVWSPFSSVFGGVSALTQLPVNRYAMDNDGQNLSIKISDGYTFSEKYTSLSTQRDSAGFSGNGNDVSIVLSYGPFTIQPNDSVVLAYALMAGDNPDDLVNSTQKAYEYYHQLSSVRNVSNSNLKIYPNPAMDFLNIYGLETSNSACQYVIRSISGQVVSRGVMNSKNSKLDIGFLESGLYVLTIQNSNKVYHHKFIKR